MRTAPSPPLVVLALRQTLVGLDPETGAHRWRAALPMQVRRIFPVEGAVLVVLADPPTHGAVHVFDLATGMSRSSVQLDFDPSGAAILKDGRLYLASEHGVACLTADCQLLWKGGIREVARGLFGTVPTLVISGPAGEERTQLEVGPESVSGNAGLLFGDVVAQPDLRD
jgi:hypothetical protein